MRRPIGFLVALVSLFAFGFALADTVDTVWVRTFGIVGYRNWGRAITVDNAGNIYVAGEYQSHGYLTIKYLSNGDTAWVRRFEGGSGEKEYATAVKVDFWGNVYVGGVSEISPTRSYLNYYTVKYDSAGNQLWSAKDSCGAVSNFLDRASLAMDDSGDVYLAGYSNLRTPTWDFLTVKRRPNGDTAWVRTYNGPLNGEDKARAIAVDDSGNVYVTGYSSGDSSATEDYCTIKYLPNGDTAWMRWYDGPAHNGDGAYDVVVDRARNVYVTGRSWGIGTGWDYCTIKYRSNGDTVWVRRYSGSSGSGNNDPCRLAVDRFGNVTVAGARGNGWDWCTVSYDSIGTLKWVGRYVGWPQGLSVDKGGNVYVTGQCDKGGLIFVYCTIKYDTAGAERWVAQYDSSYEAFAIALDTLSLPCVYITGDGIAGLCTTIKYAQSASGIERRGLVSGFGDQRLKVMVTTPASSMLDIRYYLPKPSKAHLSLYDVIGRRVKEWVSSGVRDAGEHRVKQRLDLIPGIYFLRLEGSGHVAMAKVIVVR